MSDKSPPTILAAAATDSASQLLLRHVQLQIVQLREPAQGVADPRDPLDMDEIERHEAIADALIPNLPRFLRFSDMENALEEHAAVKAMQATEDADAVMARAKQLHSSGQYIDAMRTWRALTVHASTHVVGDADAMRCLFHVRGYLRLCPAWVRPCPCCKKALCSCRSQWLRHTTFIRPMAFAHAQSRLCLHLMVS